MDTSLSEWIILEDASEAQEVATTLSGNTAALFAEVYHTWLFSRNSTVAPVTRIPSTSVG
jgi:hypothetical protein